MCPPFYKGKPDMTLQVFAKPTPADFGSVRNKLRKRAKSALSMPTIYHPRQTVGSFEILKGIRMSRFTKSNDNAANEMNAVSRSAKTAKIITPNPKQLVRDFLGDFCAWPTSG